ncbi:putative phosphatidate phosphatase isoform X5 [Apis mellifera]|uniref:Phosphatidate phosphatase isoform X5 n=1 Tax=Apis mellifera TaxID=7460 RepID=A0A7M7MS46_APIME|nr:putative phosphatidate phosphatase isoform X5 [Apis mellifera]|eukprot:XP_026299880.1 putative phosphatidate phosphatase isoform X5 [Apis mellifera]
MDRSSKMILRKIIIDFVCIFIVGMTVLMFHLFGKPYKRGFFCNDESLYHPFHDSTVTSAMLYVIGLLLPIFTIGIFGFGAATTVLFTDIAKYTIGRLRPHFMTLCEPNINCSLIENQHRYIENYSCSQNISKSLLKEIRLSFPSGHSSFSAYTMIYLAIYLQLRITWKGSKLLKHFLQLVCLLMAWFTALSRISDYKHHWSDVLAGSTLGAITALVVVIFVADLFKDQNHYSVEEKHRTADYETGAGTQMNEITTELKAVEKSANKSSSYIHQLNEILLKHRDKDIKNVTISHPLF